MSIRAGRTLQSRARLFPFPFVIGPSVIAPWKEHNSKGIKLLERADLFGFNQNRHNSPSQDKGLSHVFAGLKYLLCSQFCAKVLAYYLKHSIKMINICS